VSLTCTATILLSNSSCTSWLFVYFATFLGHKGHDESQRTQSEIPGKFESFRCFL